MFLFIVLRVKGSSFRYGYERVYPTVVQNKVVMQTQDIDTGTL